MESIGPSLEAEEIPIVPGVVGTARRDRAGPRRAQVDRNQDAEPAVAANRGKENPSRGLQQPRSVSPLLALRLFSARTTCLRQFVSLRFISYRISVLRRMISSLENTSLDLSGVIIVDCKKEKRKQQLTSFRNAVTKAKLNMERKKCEWRLYVCNTEHFDCHV